MMMEVAKVTVLHHERRHDITRNTAIKMSFLCLLLASDAVLVF
jgi:hypothetical protein